MTTQAFYFAWVGGAVPDTVMLSTRGDTHGAILQTLSITGTLFAGSRVLSGASNTGALSIGALYAVSGTGIAAGTTLIYAGGNAIELSIAATADVIDATLSLTAAIALFSTTASILAGNAQVTLADVSSLVSGATYALTGSGIATGSSFVYSSGSTVNLSLSALSTLSATQVTISGTPARSAFLIDGIEDLTGVTPGLIYNIGGPGIPEGAGFVAPAIGATAITIDMPTTDTRVLSPLVITGPRILDGGAFNAGIHNVENEQILSIDLAQTEGDFAALNIEIKNPHVGLLTHSRQVWCWLSWDDGAGAITPLFHGRLTGYPSDLQAEAITLQFVATPNDFAAQKQAVADALKVSPYWDPVWLQARLGDADAVLETYSSLWHVDRTTLVVTASDIAIGEDGLIEIGEDLHLYDSMSMSYGQPPLRAMTITGAVSWTQQGSGTIDLTKKIAQAFRAGGSPYKSPLISTLTGDGLKSAWPTPGAAIGGGWTFADTNTIIEATPQRSTVQGITGATGFRNGWVSAYTYKVTYTAQSQTAGVTALALGKLFLDSWITYHVKFPLTVFQILLGVRYEATRKRSETVSFTLFADVQPVITDAGKGEETLELNSEFVGLAIDTDGTVPIKDLRANSYFKIDRGAQSFEYLLLLARAKLRARARCIDIKFTVPWKTGLAFTCRKSARLIDRRLPGGVAEGKVREYRLLADDQGQRGEITIACSVGRGNTTAASAGVGDYAADGYMAPGYQRMLNAKLSVVDGELTYESFGDFSVTDDGVDLFNLNADTALLNYSVNDVPSVSFSLNGDVTQGSTVVAHLSDLSSLLSATASVKSRIFKIKGTGIPLGATCTYAAGVLTLNKAATFTPSAPINSAASAKPNTALLITAETRNVVLTLTGDHLISGLLQGGLTEQVNTIQAHTVRSTEVGSDPVTALGKLPTVITLDLPDLTGEFATSFAPQVSPLMLPRTIDLEASSKS